jgi:hypothetical protein
MRDLHPEIQTSPRDRHVVSGVEHRDPSTVVLAWEGSGAK